MNQEELQLASSSLPARAQEIRTKLGETGFRLLVHCLQSEMSAAKAVRIMKLIGADVKHYQISLWRQAWTFQHREVVKALQPYAQTLTLIPGENTNHSEQSGGVKIL